MSTVEISRERVLERRKEWKQLVEYLRSDLYERGRDYSDSSLKKPVLPIKPPLDPSKEGCWGSPLGWRCVLHCDIENDPKQAITIRIHDIDGMIVKGGSFTYDEFNYNVGINWLHSFLP